jgi:putative ABC transport system permease protein
MIRHLLKLVWKRKRSNALLTLEIFFSFLVLFGVATLGASMIIRYQRPLGFDYHDVWVVGIPFQSPPGQENAAMPLRQMIDGMLRELRSMPEIEAATAAGMPPCSPAGWDNSGDYNGRHYEASRDSVSDDFNKVMRVPLLQGRWFGPEDEAAPLRPVVIDSDLAKQIAPDGKAVGIEFGFGAKSPFKVIGVIAPFRKDGEFSKDHVNMAIDRISLTRPEGNVPHYLLVRVRRGTPADFEQTVTKRLHAIAPEHPVRIGHMDRMHRDMNRMYLSPVITGSVVAAFLVMMVFLGLSGVLWQNVTRRTREIGLRRALGATGAVVYRQILTEVALLSTLAVIVGLVIVAQLPIIGIFRFVTPLAYGIGIVAALATIYALTLLCGLYPSWLAGRVQPAQALHYE